MALYAAKKRSPQDWQRIETLAEAEKVMEDPTYESFSVDGGTDMDAIIRRVQKSMPTIIYIHETVPNKLCALVRSIYDVYQKLPENQRQYMPCALICPRS